MLEGAAGFWSYVHADDEGEQNRISSLAAHLKTQYRLATGGEELDLFIDKDIRWGEEWEKRIGQAIAGTTFFIPIITPSYFESQACRKELLEFVREAERLGLEKLVMPIYWRTVPELESQPEASADAGIRIIHTYQRKDFRAARLEDEESSIFRKAVDDLAEELVRRASEAEIVEDVPVAITTPRRNDTESEETENEEPGVLETLAIGEEALQKVTEVIGSFGKELEVIAEVTQKADTAFTNAAAKGVNARAGLVVTERFARDLDGPAKRVEQLGSEFAARLIEIDAAVEAQLDLVSGDQGRLEPDIREELESYRQLDAVVGQVSSELKDLIVSTSPLVRMSRSLRAPIRHLRNGLQSIVDGRETMTKWSERATEVLADRDGER